MFAESPGAPDAPLRKAHPLRSRIARRSARLARPWLDRASSRVSANVPLLEGVLSKVDPTLSLHRVLARVVAVRDETADVKTFVLRPNARFGDYQAGAHVRVHLVLDGRAVQRTYSLSSAPSAGGLPTITVKRVAGGVVSNYLANAVAPGHVLELSAPDGQFTLPRALPPKLLMISAGSGITPVMSMLRHLIAVRSATEVTFLHFARTPEDVIFKQELEQAARSHANVRLVLCVEQADGSWRGPTGRFTRALLEESAPDFRELDTYLCGPGGFMRSVVQAYEAAEADLGKLRYELFNSDFDVSEILEQSHLVRFTRSGVDSLANRPLTILQQAEAKGLRVETGCRAGTCGTCRCKKKSGVVFNVATQRESGAGEELIFPCVSVARSSVEIDL